MALGKEFPLSVVLRMVNRTSGPMLAASRYLKKFGREMSDMGRSLRNRLTLPIAAGAAASVKIALDLDRATRLAAINLSQGVGDDQFLANLAGIQEGVSEIAREVPQTQREIATAAVGAARSTGDLNAALARTRLSAEIATVAGEDIVSVMAAMPRMANIFGASTIDEMRQVGDEIQFLASNVVSGFLEMSEGVLEAAPAAKDLGVSRQETMAMVAVLQDMGLESTKAGRATRSMFAQLAKQGKELRRFGVDVDGLFTNGKLTGGIRSVIDAMSDVIPKDQIEEARALFRQLAAESPEADADAIAAAVRARLGVRAGFGDIVQFMEVFGAQGLSILMANADRFEEILQGVMERSSGTLATGIRRAMEGDAAEMDLFLNQMQELGVEIARSGLLEVLKEVLEVVKELIQTFMSLPKEARTTAIKGALLAAIAGPAMQLIGGGASLTGGLFGLFSKAAKSFGAGGAVATAATTASAAAGGAAGGRVLLPFLGRAVGSTAAALPFADFLRRGFTGGLAEDDRAAAMLSRRGFDAQGRVRVEFSNLPAGARVSSDGAVSVDTGEILR